jgi:hypothetical protein
MCNALATLCIGVELHLVRALCAWPMTHSMHSQRTCWAHQSKPGSVTHIECIA